MLVILQAFQDPRKFLLQHLAWSTPRTSFVDVPMNRIHRPSLASNWSRTTRKTFSCRTYGQPFVSGNRSETCCPPKISRLIKHLGQGPEVDEMEPDPGAADRIKHVRCSVFGEQGEQLRHSYSTTSVSDQLVQLAHLVYRPGLRHLLQTAVCDTNLDVYLRLITCT